MKIDILTLFPEMFEGVLNSSILGRAQKERLVQYQTINFRQFSGNKHGSVDDYPYGGGGGMVLKPEPLFRAVESVAAESELPPRILLMSPQGERFTQRKAEELSREKHLLFICGHYEGYDERIRRHLATDELSIGDFVLTGGELPAMVIIDSIVRLLPGVLGNETSAATDSFSTGLLEHPHYTRPADFRGYRVPDVLLSGNHEKIAEWRKKESLRRTLLRRPDMLEEANLDAEEERLLSEVRKELQNESEA